MNADLPKNKLQVHYRVLQPGEIETVWVAGTSAGDTVPERWPAWQWLSRFQWFPAGLEGEQLKRAIIEELRRSHPTATEVVLERVTVLRQGMAVKDP
jgi:hypothetical protein